MVGKGNSPLKRATGLVMLGCLVMVLCCGISVEAKCKACPWKCGACLTLYAPVCGCDGITYSNACVAHCQCIDKTTPGACVPRPTKP
ncbi:hypothetical protein CBR_g34875 [Chara braunii]|uniref:Kazal-like domain-containing protein n=1 Tax=Chara braunii TaxID=69332 RepID=A0A388LJK4_CHABU|nr:hypothetical protein CBR_g34875 [Chara braunii]|eukprot:GBG82498.1 hypothetical protein CBR_g34875 [Chara braunii]